MVNTRSVSDPEAYTIARYSDGLVVVVPDRDADSHLAALFDAVSELRKDVCHSRSLIQENPIICRGQKLHRLTCDGDYGATVTVRIDSNIATS